MFSGFMVNAWIAGSIVAVIAGLIGFFVVLRGSAFAAHAIPNGSFAGATGAGLLGINLLIGLGVFSLLGALAIGWLGRRDRRDVATALTLVAMLGLGFLFLSFTVDSAPAGYSLLFGEILGVSNSQLLPTALLALASLAALGQLKQLDIWVGIDNRFSPEAIKRLKKSLPKCTIDFLPDLLSP